MPSEQLDVRIDPDGAIWVHSYASRNRSRLFIREIKGCDEDHIHAGNLADIIAIRQSSKRLSHGNRQDVVVEHLLQMSATRDMVLQLGGGSETSLA